MPTVYFHNSFVNSAHMGDFLPVGNAAIHFYEDGAGRPLILLPPAGLSLFTYRKNITFLAQYARVFALELPGQGYAAFGEKTRFSCHAMADTIADFIDFYNLKRAVLCGVGQSAIYAMEAALRYPNLVEALIIISPGGVTRQQPLSLQLMEHERIGRLLMQKLTPAIMARFLSWCYYDETMVDRYMLRQVMQPYETAQARTGLQRMLLAFSDQYAMANLQQIEQPTLVMWGRHDAVHPIDQLRNFAALPNAAQRVIGRCGYLPQEERHQDFNPLVRDFVQALPRHRSTRAFNRQVRIDFEA